MRKTVKYKLPGSYPNIEELEYHSPLVWLNGNNPNKTSLLAIGRIDEFTSKPIQALKNFYKEKQDWLFGYFTYDLKNELEKLKSENIDELRFPSLHFFQPEFVIQIINGIAEISYHKNHTSKEAVDQIIEQTSVPHSVSSPLLPSRINVKSRVSKEQYIQTVKELKRHIQVGDVYEINFCQEYYANNSVIDPLETYQNLNQISPMPFSCFYGLDDKYLMCASPERFLKKEGNRIISQPIKGTIKRGNSGNKDEKLKKDLSHSIKEKSENVMIVDLVRNDLSRSAKKNTVKVDELFGIYTFPQVHQMISTVSAELHDDIHFIDAIKNAFPMGSMTGAPKVRAMQLIEKYESTKRGLFSGAVGYITPNGDFDFNVVIRSMLYNATEKYLSFMVGGAITDKSVPEKEYEECLLKAKAIFETLGISA